MNPALLCELGQRAFVAFMSEDDWDYCIARALQAPPQAMYLARQCAELEFGARP